MTLANFATTTVAVSLLIVIVLAIREPVARRFGANMAYALWLLPALRLIMPPLPSNLSPFGWIHFDTPRALLATGTPVPASHAAPAAAPDWIPAPHAPPASPNTELGAQVSTPTLENSGAVDISTFGQEVTLPFDLPSLTLVLTGLVVSVIAFLGHTLYRQARFARLVRDEAVPAPFPVNQMAETIRKELGIKKAVAVRSSYLPSSPMVMGILRPTILVPAWFHLDYTAEEQRLALTHELAHVKRGDLWALYIAHALLALQWFNPLAHVALRAFRADQEAACDATVLTRGNANPHAYGATLLKAVQGMRPARQLHVAGLTLDHGLKERFRRMTWKRAEPSRLGQGAALASGALLVLASASTVSAHDETLLGGKDGEMAAPTHGESRIIQLERDNRLVLAEDPFADMHEALARLGTMHDDLPPPPGADMPPPPVPPVPPNIDRHAMHFDLDLGDLEGKFAFDSLSDLGDLAALGVLEGLAEEDFEVITSADGQSITVRSDMFNLALTGWDEAGMEAFEGRMVAFEAQMDAYAERIEAQAEAYAAQIEARVEAIVEGPDFERATKDGDRVMKRLSKSCDRAVKRGQQASIVEARAPHSGKTFKALCMDETAPMTGEELSRFLNDQDELSGAERDTFLKGR